MNLGFASGLVWIHTRNIYICWRSPHISGNLGPLLRVYAENVFRSLELKVDMKIYSKSYLSRESSRKAKQEFWVSVRNYRKGQGFWYQVSSVSGCRRFLVDVVFTKDFFQFCLSHMQLLVGGISQVFRKVAERSREYFSMLMLESFPLMAFRLLDGFRLFGLGRKHSAFPIFPSSSVGRVERFWYQLLGAQKFWWRVFNVSCCHTGKFWVKRRTGRLFLRQGKIIGLRVTPLSLGLWFTFLLWKSGALLNSNRVQRKIYLINFGQVIFASSLNLMSGHDAKHCVLHSCRASQDRPSPDPLRNGSDPRRSTFWSGPPFSRFEPHC